MPDDDPVVPDLAPDELRCPHCRSPNVMVTQPWVINWTGFHLIIVCTDCGDAHWYPNEPDRIT